MCVCGSAPGASWGFDFACPSTRWELVLTRSFNLVGASETRVFHPLNLVHATATYGDMYGTCSALWEKDFPSIGQLVTYGCTPVMMAPGFVLGGCYFLGRLVWGKCVMKSINETCTNHLFLTCQLTITSEWFAPVEHSTASGHSHQRNYAKVTSGEFIGRTNSFTQISQQAGDLIRSSSTIGSVEKRSRTSDNFCFQRPRLRPYQLGSFPLLYQLAKRIPKERLRPHPVVHFWENWEVNCSSSRTWLSSQSATPAKGCHVKCLIFEGFEELVPYSGIREVTDLSRFAHLAHIQLDQSRYCGHWLHWRLSNHLQM